MKYRVAVDYFGQLAVDCATDTPVVKEIVEYSVQVRRFGVWVTVKRFRDEDSSFARREAYELLVKLEE